MALSVDEIKTVMKFHLRNFNDEGVKIDDETIHSDVLSPNDGFGHANSQNIYQGFMRVTFQRNGHGDPAWPNDWMDMSVIDLASSLSN